MELKSFLEILEDGPIIAAVKSDADLEKCLKSDCRIVFVLYGNVLSIIDIINRVKNAGKVVVVYLDLIEGLSTQNAAVDYIIHHTQPDGFMSTKLGLLQRAKAKGFLTIQRFFLLDSAVLKNIPHQLSQSGADMLELLPGTMPKIISRLTFMVETPIIVGGLISDKEDVMSALGAGAVGISTTNEKIWEL